MYFAILINKNRNYMLAKFNVEAERDTFVKFTNFLPMNGKQARKYIDPKVFHLCNGNQRVVYDNNGVCMGRINSLYRSISEQVTERPEDNAVLLAPKAKSKHVVVGRELRHS